MWVDEVKSMARKPARSSLPAISRIWAVLRPVAPHRLWLPSRIETSTSRTSAIGQLIHGAIAVEEARIDAAGGEAGVGSDPSVRTRRRFNALDRQHRERRGEP